MLWYIIPPVITGVIGYFVGRRGFLSSVQDVTTAVNEVKAEVQKK